MSSNEARVRAEKTFKAEERAREGAQAWQDHQAEALATAAKTERLRALRLAKEAADRGAQSPVPDVPKPATKSGTAKSTRSRIKRAG